MCHLPALELLLSRFRSMHLELSQVIEIILNEKVLNAISI